MNETGFIRKFNKTYLSKEVRYWKISDRFKGGVFDCRYYTQNDRNLWVEWKFDKNCPNVINFHRKLRKNQKNWGNDHLKLGHRIMVLYATQHEGVILVPNELWESSVTKAYFIENKLSYEKTATLIEEELTKNVNIPQ